MKIIERILNPTNTVLSVTYFPFCNNIVSKLFLRIQFAISKQEIPFSKHRLTYNIHDRATK